jgi:hypothetical protein
MDLMCKNIRETDNNSIICLPGHAMGQGHEVWLERGNDMIEKYDNIMFEIHCYRTYWSGSEAQESAKFKSVLDVGPLMIGEIGNNGQEPYRNQIAAAKKLGVGGLFWLWGQFSGMTGFVKSYCGENYNADWEPWCLGPPDTMPPTALGAFTPLRNGAINVTFQWTPSTDDNQIKSYKLYNGADLIGSAPGDVTQYEFDGFIPETSYNLHCIASDGRNESTPSNTLQLTTLPPQPARLPLKINCGGDQEGEFAADKAYFEGADFGYLAMGRTTTGYNSIGTANEKVYQSVRFEEVNYTLFVPNGELNVTLMFCDQWRDSPGARVFSGTINSHSINNGSIDVVSLAGGQNKPYDYTTELTVHDNTITIELTGDSDNDPILSGIVVEGISVSVDIDMQIGTDIDRKYPFTRTLRAGDRILFFDIQGRRAGRPLEVKADGIMPRFYTLSNNLFYAVIKRKGAVIRRIKVMTPE